MKHIFLTILLTFIFSIMAAQNTQPDFAYPQEVSAAAQKELKTALKKGDGRGVVNSLINYSVAQRLIDKDSAPESIKCIEKIIQKEKDPCTRALLNTVLIDLYLDIYTSNNHKYNNRKVKSQPLPDDIFKWNGEQFQQKILSLSQDATSNSEALKLSKLSEYSSIIKLDNLTEVFYPTLYDFVARRCINIVDKMQVQSAKIDHSLLCKFEEFQHLEFDEANPYNQFILSTYQNLLKFHSNHPAPFISCQLDCYKFIDQHATNPQSSESRNLTSLLQDLYQQYIDSEYSAEILLALDGHAKDTWLYNAITDHINRFPLYERNSCLRNVLDKISQQTINITTKNIIAPGDTLDISIKNQNTKKFTLYLYRLPDNGRVYYSSYYIEKGSKDKPTLVLSKEINTDSVVPFSIEQNIQLTIDQAGYYYLSTDLKDDGSNYHKVIHCSNLALLSTKFNDEFWASVVNPKTGKPVKNADLLIVDKDFPTDKVASTDINGHAKIDQTSVHIVAVKDGNMSNYQDFTNWDQSDKTKKNITGKCLTDLAVYHPGDIVNWTAIIYNASSKPSLRQNARITATIHNPNNQLVETVKLTTDEWGRVNSSFSIPTDGLTGSWRITLKSGTKTLSLSSFTVSDYKLPTFYAEFTSTEKNSPSKGDITLTGKVSTYSGIPVANAKTLVNIKSSSRWSWRIFDNDAPLYSTETTTDNEGLFSITIAADMLESVDIPHRYFSALATVTSEIGENQTAKTFFTTGKPWEISENISTNSLIKADNTLHLNVKVADENENIVATYLNYKITDTENKTTYLSGQIHTANPQIDASSLPSGKYNLTFATPNNELADTVFARDIILYRENDAMPPVETSLWVPLTDINIESDTQSTEIICGTSFDNSYIDMIVYTENNILSRKWLNLNAGNHNIKIDTPIAENNIQVSFIIIHNYKCDSQHISINRKDNNSEITIKTEVFRDKITPCVAETWKFTVTNMSGEGIKSAILFDMYNKALDKIKSHTFNFSPCIRLSDPLKFDSFRESDIYLHICEPYDFHGLCNNVMAPVFSAYEDHFNPGFALFAEEMDMVCYNIKTSNRLGLPSPSGYNAEEPDDENIPSNIDPSIYRPSEIALAFFEPNLVTDEQGKLTYTFTVPNANTTWSFNAVAYTDRLATAHMNCDVVANKPIMVQPNLPRFLRTGDKAVIKAAIQNNTDEVQTTVTTIEIFNLANNEVLSQWQFTDTIDAMQSAINDIVVDAPFDMSMLGYRIKSTNGTFTDGEQAVISILPSATPVIEADNFYMSPQSHRKEIEMGIIPDNARTTLQFCENPIWYCVTALPGMRNSESTSANSAIAAIYSAAIADGIMRNNPNIASALHQWIKSDNRDSTLTSMLERNQDLKTVLLNATPWMMDAHSDSERMARLALLFDKKEIRRVYHENITLLGQLQNADGGWRWIKQSNITSTWTTLNVLVMCGHMKKLGYLPDNQPFNTMIEKAVKYIDDLYARQYAKYPKANTDYTRYVYVRDYFDDIKQSTAAARVTAATVQALLSDWKGYSILGKSIAALILNNHSYSNTARQVLNSLRQYSRYTPDNGMWWPSVDYDSTIDKVGITAIALDAFNAIEPKCEDIDRIRQWLILQKNATDWGNSVNTTLAIHSIISTGTKWTTPARGVEIALDGTEISTSKFETATGYIRTDISAHSPSGKTLAIAKPASTPAWGAIFRQFTQAMAHVDASACDALSIDKQLYRQVATPNGTTWEKADSISLGDVVKVALTIKANRDLDYVTIIDDRAACFEPVEQLPQPIFTEGIYFYRENRDAATNIFVDHLPKGTYIISYELNVNNIGSYSSGIAKIQSQYAPNITAHSAGSSISISR